jgi:hypothetical protein
MEKAAGIFDEYHEPIMHEHFCVSATYVIFKDEFITNSTIAAHLFSFLRRDCAPFRETRSVERNLQRTDMACLISHTTGIVSACF